MGGPDHDLEMVPDRLARPTLTVTPPFVRNAARPSTTRMPGQYAANGRANSTVSFAKATLPYPLFAADFDPYNRGYLVVGGGGGESKTGVPNQIVGCS